MEKSVQENAFDFSKPITKVLEKTSRYNYKKLLFLSISFSLFTSLGISVTSHVYEHFAQEKAQKILQQQEQQKQEQQEQQEQEQQKQQEQQKEQKILNFEKQQIQAMSPEKFQNFQTYLVKNITVYDTEVEFIQTVVADIYNIADNQIEIPKELQNKNRYLNYLDMDYANSLGKELIQHQNDLKNNISVIMETYQNIKNNLPTQDQNIQLFMKYYRLYQTKSIISNKKIDKDIQDILYFSNDTTKYLNFNDYYDVQNHIYQQFDKLHQTMLASFNNVDNVSKKQKP